LKSLGDAKDPGLGPWRAGSTRDSPLNETPIIFAYFYNYLTATAMGVTGVYPTAIGHLFLQNAAKS